MDLLPFDVLKAILRLLSSEERAYVCGVSKIFNQESMVVSKQKSELTHVFDSNHRLTINELLVIMESNDVHAFIRHQHELKNMKLGDDRIWRYLMDTVCIGGNSKMIIAVVEVVRTIDTGNLKAIYESKSVDAYSHIMRKSQFYDRVSNQNIYIPERCYQLCIEYACEWGYLDIAETIILQLHDNPYYNKNRYLTIACKYNQTDICIMLIHNGATKCKSQYCPGHEWI